MKFQDIANISFGADQIKYYTMLQDNYQRDIIPGVYQGGFKVWECTIDLINYIVSKNIQFNGKRVLDLGCGHGLLGISAIKKGAQICAFQDYNKDVLQKITVKNLQINEINQSKANFMHGDWKQICDEYTGGQFDIILGSQVIYRQENYQKVVYFCKKMLKNDGIAYLANKHYYFGVGGNMPNFKNYIEENQMAFQSLQKIVPAKGGNKKQIIALFRNKTN